MLSKFFKKRSITLLDEKWNVIKPNIKVKYIPRCGELIYMEDITLYYEVINVIHYINNNEGIFIVRDG